MRGYSQQRGVKILLSLLMAVMVFLIFLVIVQYLQIKCISYNVRYLNSLVEYSSRKTLFISKYKEKIRKCNEKISDVEIVLILSCIFDQCELYDDLEPELLLALYQLESNFSPTAKSLKNAYGLGQIIKPTADLVASRLNMVEYDLMDISDNIKISSYYLLMCVRQYGLRDGLAAYYAGRNFHVGLWYADSVLVLYRKWKLEND